ncbi:MAG: DNA gyrase subunit A [Leptospirales bacterium]
MADKKTPNIPPSDSEQNIVPVEIEDQMKTSYLAYAMSVIVGRALPDVRDGLKPVHRRILHAMNERGWRNDKAYVKSAKIVGEVIGNFHPHGDAAVYDTMVRMVQEFAMRVPLIDGQGNFGSVDGDHAAAYRYTEARLTKMAVELLKDIDKDTVNFQPNFDDTRKEPKVLPAAYPNLLTNGSSGIAVGMATKIPPHNLNELTDAINYLIEKPDCSPRELMKFVPAPDFPTGGIVYGKEGLVNAYTTGRGSIKIRGVADFEDVGKKRAIIVSEIPYEIKKNDLISKIAKLVTDKKIEGISDIRDESDRTGMRIVFELKRDTNEQIVLNQLYTRSNLEVSYGIIFLALVNNEPKLLNIHEMLTHYIAHRKEIVTRRTQYLLNEAERKAHILEGLKTALDFIDEVIKIIRASKAVDDAKKSLIARFKFSDVQTTAILEMRLQKLTSLEVNKIVEELKELKSTIKGLSDLLKSEKKIYGVVKSELAAVREKFGTPRKSNVSKDQFAPVTKNNEDLIHNQDEVITLSENGYIRRVPVDTFKRQHRGGKGVVSGGKKEDLLKHVHFCRSLDIILLFSNRGKVFSIKAYEIPEASKDARGKSLRGLLSLNDDEFITVVKSIKDFKDGIYLVLLTRSGIIKKMDVTTLQNAKKGGVMAVQFKNANEDWLIDVAVVSEKDEIFMGTAKGLGLRTSLAKMRAQGRAASGIIGMVIAKDDYMIALDVVSEAEEMFVIASTGQGKRVRYSEFAPKGRGGKGMTFMKVTAKTGDIVSIRTVKDSGEGIIITDNGMTVRVGMIDIPVQGRTASGVKVVVLKENDKITGVTVWKE